MWNFERKWAKNNFLICRALWGNGVVWVCLRGGGDADWVSCWLSWLTMWLNQWIVGIVDRVGWFGWWLCMFSLGLGVQWVGWLYFDSGGRWLGHWMVGNGGESECVCEWCWLGVGYVSGSCVCRGWGWGQWWVLTELDDNDDDLVCVHWGWVYNELDDCILTYWWEVVTSLDGWEWGWVRCVWCWLGVG